MLIVPKTTRLGARLDFSLADTFSVFFETDGECRSGTTALALAVRLRLTAGATLSMHIDLSFECRLGSSVFTRVSRLLLTPVTAGDCRELAPRTRRLHRRRSVHQYSPRYHDFSRLQLLLVMAIHCHDIILIPSTVVKLSMSTVHF